MTPVLKNILNLFLCRPKKKKKIKIKIKKFLFFGNFLPGFEITFNSFFQTNFPHTLFKNEEGQVSYRGGVNYEDYHI